MEETLMRVVLDNVKGEDAETSSEFSPDRSKSGSSYITSRKPQPVYTEAGR